MQATIEFVDADGAMTVAQAQAAVALGRDMAPDSVFMGTVTLADDAQTLVLEDDLQFLIPALCLRAPPTLAATGSAELPLASSPQTFTLRRDGDAVLILETGDEGETERARFPYAPLLDALHDCVESFSRFADDLADAQPQWVPMRDFFDRELRREGVG